MERPLRIAIAKTRKTKQWHNTEWSWEQICEKCSTPKRTGETLPEYMHMSKDEQGRIKDVGGFVGGGLKDGVRKSGNVKFRSLITLDLDNEPHGAWEAFKAKYQCEALIYSTHKHTPEKPRYRLVIPLARGASPDEYEPIARRVADDIGIEMADPTTYEPSRMMYWPSVSRGAVFFFDRQHGEWLNPADVLSTYADWQDTSQWPRSEQENEVRRKERGKMGDPRDKPGVIGAFCRAYTIEEAIEAFLGDVYEPTSVPGRYTYKEGSMAGGLVCYEELYAFSFHATDPAGRRERNAFDLVRIHKFGELDGDRETDDVTGTKSYKAMTDFARKDERVGKLLTRESLERAKDDFGDFGDDEEAEPEWKLDHDKSGRPLSTIKNFVTILENDPSLRGRLWKDEFRGNYMITGGLPWRNDAEKWNNEDDANLRGYMEDKWDITGKEKLKDARTMVFTKHARNPLKEYLTSLRWDGTPRLDSLLVDTLGADDTPLTRAVTRLHFTAAVARAMTPGCKYDVCLILAGPEGIGKSTLFKIMGGEWFNDSLSLAGMDSKQAMEAVKEDWIFELSELSGLKKSEVEPIKAFITKQQDKFRPAYGEVTECFPRHCVFCGTTNETAFLKGDTGNRRFIVIDTRGTGKPVAETFAWLEENRDQLWAEAMTRWREGEKLYLNAEMEAEARLTQEAHHENTEDPMPGMVEAFLNMLLPDDWETRSREQREKFYKDVADADPNTPLGVKRRSQVCAAEYISEYLRKDTTSVDGRILVRKFNAIMRRNDQWEEVRLLGHVAQDWGRQRGFRRKNVYDEDDI